MSYILDSLKKSDKERHSSDSSSSMVMRSPAFLENEKKATNYKWFVIFFVILCFFVAVYFLALYSGVKLPTLQFVEKNTSAMENKLQAFGDNSKAKEEAVLLYQQALAKKAKPEIDLLYQELKVKSVSRDEDAVPTEQSSPIIEASELLASAPVSTASQPEERVAVIDNTPAPAPVPIAEPTIPSIYELDVLIRRSIPSVDYGAHIYATDNNSGFVILDGARRRVGDKLDSGLFVEKIEEESVVLSYNGTLFSLPAMKSWEGN